MIIDADTPTKTPPPVPAHILAAQKPGQAPPLGTSQTILSQGKLKGGTFEVRVTGEVGAREIGKIIKLLEAQKAILSEDDENEDD